MGFGGLALFMTAMWTMILAVSAFLVIIIAPMDHYFGQAGRLAVSALQASIAIIAVIGLIFGLSRMKRIYVEKKLRS